MIDFPFPPPPGFTSPSEHRKPLVRPSGGGLRESFSDFPPPLVF